MNNKAMKAADKKIDDSLKSIAAIKGERYRDVVAWLISGLHLQRMLKVICAEVDSEHIDKVIGHQTSLVLAQATSMLCSDIGIKSETECRELMNWADTLVEHLHEALMKEEE
jgi:hypothetical protein